MLYKRKNFVDSLVPQFVREEYPLFVSFLREYYSYLDRRAGELACIVVTSPGNNYSSSDTISLSIWDETTQQYIADPKGAEVELSVTSGRVSKILVLNPGSGYTTADDLQVNITSTNGTGCTVRPVIIENLGEISPAAAQVQSSRDMDNDIPILLNFLREEYIPKIPKTLHADVELLKFLKFIKQFYKKAGIEDSVKFLYRILFNVDVNFYYPKVDMLRVSDGKWNIDRIVNMLGESGSVYDILEYDTEEEGLESVRELLIGQRIYVQGAFYGTVQSVKIGGGSGGESLWRVGVGALANLSTFPGTLLSESLSAGTVVSLYPLSGVLTTIGTTALDNSNRVYYEENGAYSGDDGQLSSTKRIQDSYYYQEFSYELQSEESIQIYNHLLEELIHPAGLKYFIRLNLEATASLDMSRDSSSNILGEGDADVRYSGISPVLGPRWGDIDSEKDTPSSHPASYQEYQSVLGLGSTAPFTSITLNHLFLNPNDDYYFGWTFIGNGGFSDIIFYNGSTKNALISPAVDPAGSLTLNWTMTDLHRPESCDNVACELVLRQQGILPSRGDFYQNFWSDEYFTGWRLYIVHGDAAGEYRYVTGMGATGVILYDTPFGSTSPTSNSTYFLFPDFGASGINSGYYTGSVTDIEIGGNGYGYVQPIVTIDPPLGYLSGGLTAGASAIVGASGVITSLVITEPGSGYITAPSITITDGATGVLPSHTTWAAADINPLSDAPWESSTPNGYRIAYGISYLPYDEVSVFRTAKGYTTISMNGSIATFVVDDPGSGYTHPPRIRIIKGGAGGSGASVTCEIVDGAVDSFVINSIGNNYEEAPLVEFEESAPFLGESILQSSTGAGGILIGSTEDFLIVQRNTEVPFDSSDVTYAGEIPINITGNPQNVEARNLKTSINPSQTEVQILNA